MANKNTLARKSPAKLTFAEYINNDAVQQATARAVGARAPEFLSSLSSAVTANPALKDCDHASLVNAGLIGFALELAPSPQLGQFYLVPYNRGYGANKSKQAQFQLGYRGYIQLAIRSGQYENIGASSVKAGELVRYNRFRDEVELNPLEDPEEVQNAETVGYYAHFRLLNGFRKEVYWTRSQMEYHAKQFSKAYAYDLKEGKASSVWSTNFDAMAEKTLIRHLISKWGVMSVQMQKGFDNDMKVFDADGNGEYADNDGGEPIDITPEDVPTERKQQQQQKAQPQSTDPEEPPFEPDFEDMFFG